MSYIMQPRDYIKFIIPIVEDEVVVGHTHHTYCTPTKTLCIENFAGAETEPHLVMTYMLRTREFATWTARSRELSVANDDSTPSRVDEDTRRNTRWLGGYDAGTQNPRYDLSDRAEFAQLYAEAHDV